MDRLLLGGGSLLGSSPAVQVHRDRMDEGSQAEHSQTNIDLKVEGRTECVYKIKDRNKCSSNRITILCSHI